MPGAGKQPLAVQEQIRELLEAGFDPTTIHRRLKVGRSSIYRMKRSLQQHGSAYMPVEMNKKNGRPKVLSAEQELEVRNWLREPKNRGRYLDDLVWLIHDRFGIVCSTTTMSKLKRKWLRVIECQERGEMLDEALVAETQPALPGLSQEGTVASMLPMMAGQIDGRLGDAIGVGPADLTTVQEGAQRDGNLDHQQPAQHLSVRETQDLDYSPHHTHQLPAQHPQQEQEQEPDYIYPSPPSQHHQHRSSNSSSSSDNHYPPPPPLPPSGPLTDPQLHSLTQPPPPQTLPPEIDPRIQQLQTQAIDAQLQQQLQHEMALQATTADAGRV